MDSQLVVLTPQELIRNSTDIAGLCREIVERTARKIGDRKFVPVEGWMAIATGHGCVASARDVEKVEDGFRAIGEVRRMTDGFVVATGEGFVGKDEPTWFGGEVIDRQGNKKMMPKRLDYAIRAMAQTRAISRACRSAFAHVVVLMNAGLSTTPAEEVPEGGFDERRIDPEQTQQPEKHRPHAPYEEAKSTKPESAIADVAMMRTWCRDNFVEENHVLACARKGKMIDDRITTMETIPAGVLNRLFGMRDKILERWHEWNTQNPVKTGEFAKKGYTATLPESERQEEASRTRQYDITKGDRGTKTVRVACQDEVPVEDMLRGEELDWREVRVHFGKDEGLQIEMMDAEKLDWYCDHWKPTKYRGRFSKGDLLLDAALCIAAAKRP